MLARRGTSALALLLTLVAAAAVLLTRGEPAGAGPVDPVFATLLDEQMAPADGTVEDACQAAYRPGAPGVATRDVIVPAGVGHLRITLTGGERGDFDVAVFEPNGNVAIASAERGSTESATGFTAAGGTLNVQVCRVAGGADSVPVVLEHTDVRGDAKQLRADPPQLVSVKTPNRGAKDSLLRLGLDLTEHAGEKSMGVVVHSDADREELRRAGLDFDVIVPDLVKQSVLQRRAEVARRSSRAAALPSGRTGTYRRLADYNAEMKKLADENPSIVRLITLPHKTWLGKEVMGLEISKDVNSASHKPTFFNMGVHHAREWPAGEMPMEWAHELVTKYKAGDARAVKILESSRNTIVPIVNPDGFEASREAGELAGQGGGRDESVPDTAYLALGATTGGEYRRKNCRLPDDSDGGNCLTSAGLAEPGVDPNRNYGQFWGGPGTDTNPGTQTYPGKAPFSEPESRNIRDYVATNHVMSLITNHTTAALVLRAPGLASLGDPVDEDKGYKALGDDMAKENGYFSQKGFELYDTTGTTEDWTYNATGGFGFTIEIYCGSPNYETGDCDDPAFHPTFDVGVSKEWEGDNDVANHTNDPGPNKGYDGKGMREAYYIAAESAINETRHSLLTGSAPAGATLRLTKAFKTASFAEAGTTPIEIDDKLDYTTTVPASGNFEWHVNPSTRPLVAKARGKEGAGQPSPEETSTGGPAGSSETADDPDDGAAQPQGDASLPLSTTNYNDHPFEIPATGDNASVDIKVTWNTPLSDWDIELFEDTDGDGKSGPGDKSIGTSANGATAEETVSIASPDGQTALTPGKKYVLRVVNFLAGENYTVTKTFLGFEPFTPAQIERYTLTCEASGQVLQTTTVTIARGEKKTPELGACFKAGGVTPGTGTTGQKIQLRFTGLRLRPNKQRRIRFRIDCPAGAPANCKGRFRLVTKLKGKTRFVASRRFAIKPGASRTVNPKVRRRVYRALKRGKKIKLQVRLTGRAGSSGYEVVTKNFKRLKRPKR